MVIKRFLHIIFLTAVLLGFGACSETWERPDSPSGVINEDSPVVYLTLNVGVAESNMPMSGSRASDPNYFFEQPELQSEKLNELYVIIVDDSNMVEGSRRVRYDKDGNILFDNLTFKVTPGKKTIYLFGNDMSLPQNVQSKYDKLREGDEMPLDMAAITLTRDKDDVFFPLGENIPMSEVFTVELKADPQNNPTYINKNLFVTRIAVKYTIICADDLDILMVRLNKIATKQFFLPADATYVPGKYADPEEINGVNGRNITEFTSPLSSGEEEFEIQLTGRRPIEITGNDGSKRNAFLYDSFYVMETPGTEFKISAEADFYIYEENIVKGEWLSYMTLPNLPLMPRNTHVIVNISAKAELTCTVDLVPYRGCVLEPWFGLDK